MTHDSAVQPFRVLFPSTHNSVRSQMAGGSSGSRRLNRVTPYHTPGHEVTPLW